MNLTKIAHDPDTEIALLQHLVREAGDGIEAMIELGLSGDDFVSPVHRRWWDLVLAQHEEGTLGASTVFMEVVDRPGDFGGQDLIRRITAGTDWSPHQPLTGRALAQRVRSLSLRRRAQQAATIVLDRAADPLTEIAGIRIAAEMLLAALFEAESQRRGWQHLGDLVAEEARDAIGRSEGTVATVACRTTVPALDRLLGGGFRPGELVLIAGRPAHGKSAVAAVLAVEAARQGRAVGLFSLEMAAGQLAQRALARLAQVPLQFIRTGKSLGRDDEERFAAAADTARSLPFWVDDTPGVNLGRIRTQLRQLARTSGPPGLVVVDYLQLLESERKRGDNRSTEVGQLSRGLKVMAREFECPVIALSQINRKVEDRPPAERRPMVSDLAESGRLEQDADIVLLVHRPEEYDRNDPQWRGKMEIIVGKARNGQTGSAILGWRGEYQDLEEAGAAPDHDRRGGYH